MFQVLQPWKDNYLFEVTYCAAAKNILVASTKKLHWQNECDASSPESLSPNPGQDFMQFVKANRLFCFPLSPKLHMCGWEWQPKWSFIVAQMRWESIYIPLIPFFFSL